MALASAAGVGDAAGGGEDAHALITTEVPNTTLQVATKRPSLFVSAIRSFPFLADSTWQVARCHSRHWVSMVTASVSRCSGLSTAKTASLASNTARAKVRSGSALKNVSRPASN